jgi:site-specific DNA recombinase
VARRVGLYLRISKDWKGDQAGVDRQREDGLRLIESRGWELHKIYTDNDISAAGRKRRPDYTRLLADLEDGTINAVVARSFERLCKTRREQLTFVELGQEKRTAIAFTHAPDLDLTTAIGRGMADLMAAFARVEMEQKSERHISQIAQAAAQGRMVGGRRAFGYSKSGLELDPIEPASCARCTTASSPANR